MNISNKPEHKSWKKRAALFFAVVGGVICINGAAVADTNTSIPVQKGGYEISMIEDANTKAVGAQADISVPQKDTEKASAQLADNVENNQKYSLQELYDEVFEGIVIGEGFRAQPYKLNYINIGYGYNLNAGSPEATLKILRLGGTTVNGKPITLDDVVKLQQEDATTMAATHITKAGAEKISRHIMKRDFEWVVNNTLTKVANTPERLAKLERIKDGTEVDHAMKSLIKVAYTSGPGKITTGLAEAFLDGDRAQAFFIVGFLANTYRPKYQLDEPELAKRVNPSKKMTGVARNFAVEGNAIFEDLNAMELLRAREILSQPETIAFTDALEKKYKEFFKENPEMSRQGYFDRTNVMLAEKAKEQVIAVAEASSERISSIALAFKAGKGK